MMNNNAKPNQVSDLRWTPGADAGQLPKWLTELVAPADLPIILGKQGAPAGANTARVCDLIATVLRSFQAPYPADIVDQVFIAIESDLEWLGEYFSLVTVFAGHDQHSQAIVNEMIGWFVLLLSGMVATDCHQPAQSRLTQQYTLLRHV